MPKRKVQRSGWRSVQRQSKIKKKTKLALLVLGFLLSFFLLSGLIRAAKLIHSSNYTWNGEFNLTLVFRKPLSISSYNPKEKKVTILTIPDATLIDVPFGFGLWQARSIYNLGGDKLLKTSLSKFFGIHIDALASEDLVDLFRRNLFSGISSLPYLDSDLTPLELVRLKISLIGVRFDKVKRIDLMDLMVLEKQKLLDGTEVFVADPIRLDSILSDFVDFEIKKEHLSVAVFNATDKPLLAKDAKRLIENLGGNVIVTQNAPRILEKSYVEGLDSKTLKRLIQIFDQGCYGLKAKCDKIARADLGVVESRAQIIVVLGQDFP